MPGARYENAARSRNSYPWFVTTGLRFDLGIMTAVGDTVVPFLTPPNLRIPFDAGPDRPSAVALVIHDMSVIIAADTYAPVAPVLSGIFYHLSADNRKTYLAAVNETLVVIGTIVERETIICTPHTIPVENVPDLGSLGFEHVATVFGSATLMIATVFLNIGYYPIYGERDTTKDIIAAIRELQTPEWAKQRNEDTLYQAR